MSRLCFNSSLLGWKLPIAMWVQRTSLVFARLSCSKICTVSEPRKAEAEIRIRTSLPSGIYGNSVGYINFLAMSCWKFQIKRNALIFYDPRVPLSKTFLGLLRNTRFLLAGAYLFACCLPKREIEPPLDQQMLQLLFGLWWQKIKTWVVGQKKTTMRHSLLVSIRACKGCFVDYSSGTPILMGLHT